MMEYRFEITETLSRQITIQSTSEEEAYRRIKALYQKEFLILDSSDFIDVEFTHLKEKAHKEYPCISHGEFYQFNLSSCIRQQNSLTAQFVSFSLANLANIFYPPNFYNN